LEGAAVKLMGSREVEEGTRGNSLRHGWEIGSQT